MVDITITTLLAGFFISGLGNAAGKWFFEEYLQHHTKKIVETVKELPTKAKEAQL